MLSNKIKIQYISEFGIKFFENIVKFMITTTTPRGVTLGELLNFFI